MFNRMGFGSCPICTEQLSEGIVTTRCGHIFHNICVAEWLKNNKACPTCRAVAFKRDLVKLFLDLNDESFNMSQITTDEVNHETIQKCTKLNNKLNLKVSELESVILKLQEGNDKKRHEIDRLVHNNSSLEKEKTLMQQACSNLKTKLKYVMEDSEKNRRLAEKVKVLEREVTTMKGLKIILESTQEECEDLIRNTTDIETMAHFITGVKRDYNLLQKSKTEVQQLTEDLQRKLSYSRITTQNLREEIQGLKNEKQQIEQDLSVAERRNDSLCKKIGVFEDASLNNTDLLNVSRSPKCKGRRSLNIETPIQLNKRQKREQSTPSLFDDSLEEEFKAELSKDDELEFLAAELGIDTSMADTPGKKFRKTSSEPSKEDNLFTKVGYDGLGGVARIKKSIPAKSLANKHRIPHSFAKKSTLGNFFKKL